MLLVTFHGGSGGLDNVGAYDDNGNELSQGVLTGIDPGQMSELRRVALVEDNLLWVASGARHESKILAFEGSGTSYAYRGTIASYPSIGSLWHPFDFTLDGQGNGYVTNQDSNVVARLLVASDLLSASPAPVASALPTGDTFLTATFVASANGDLPGVPATTPVSADAGGLEVSFDKACKVANSVRGVVWTNDALYVADEVAGVVRIYDDTGRYLGAASVPGGGPVHLMVAPGNDGGASLYVCNGKDVISGSLTPGSPAEVTFDTMVLKLASVSGLAIGAEGVLYAGSRDPGVAVEADGGGGHHSSKGPAVWKYTGFPEPAKGTPFRVADAPEFLLYVPDTAD
jgi:hypothetical protein